MLKQKRRKSQQVGRISKTWSIWGKIWTCLTDSTFEPDQHLLAKNCQWMGRTRLTSTNTWKSSVYQNKLWKRSPVINAALKWRTVIEQLLRHKSKACRVICLQWIFWPMVSTKGPASIFHLLVYSLLQPVDKTSIILQW